VIAVAANYMSSVSDNQKVASIETNHNLSGDESKVLTELSKVELELVEANAKGDGAKLYYFLADEYRGSGENGALLNKSQTIALKTAHPFKATIQNLRIEDAKLVNYYGDTATLSGNLMAEYVEDNKIVHYQQRFTDSFVKREGRWQAISSQTAEPINQ
jgi:hypothetical protein